MVSLEFLEDAFDETRDDAPPSDEGPAGGGVEHLATIAGDAVGDGAGEGRGRGGETAAGGELIGGAAD